MKRILTALFLLIYSLSFGQAVDTSTVVLKARYYPSTLYNKPIYQFPNNGITKALNAITNLAVIPYDWGNHASAGYLTSASATATYLPITTAATTYIPIAGATTVTGDKIFTGALTIPATTLTGSILLNSNNNRTLGNATNKFLQVFSAQFLGTGSTVFGTEGTNSLLFRQGTTTYPGGFLATTGNFFAQNPGAAAPTDNLAGAQFIHNKTASSAIARGFYIGNTLTAAANNDVLVSLDVAPTFTNGAFTGVSNYAIRASGLIVPAVTSTSDIGSTSLKWNNVYANNLRGNGTLRLSSAAGNSIIFQQSSDANTTAMMFSTSGLWAFQPPGALPTDDGVNLIQANGSIKSTQYRLSALNTAPASATATGTTGEIRITATYIYICTATNTWVRASLNTW